MASPFMSIKVKYEVLKAKGLLPAKPVKPKGKKI